MCLGRTRGISDGFWCEGKCEGKCEGRKFTLTLTLTTETPINRALQANCEGVRVKKKKTFFSFFRSRRVDKIRVNKESRFSSCSYSIYNPESPFGKLLFVPAVYLFVFLLHRLDGEALFHETSGPEREVGALGGGDGVEEDFKVFLMTVGVGDERPVLGHRLVEALAVAAYHGQSCHRGFYRHKRQSFELGGHEHIVERTEVSGYSEDGFADGYVGQRGELLFHQGLHAAGADDMEMIVGHVGETAHYIYEVADALLFLEASGKEDVRLVGHEVGVGQGVGFRHTIIYNRWCTAVFARVTFEHGPGDGDVGVVALIETLHLTAETLQSCPQTGVVDGSHDAAALLQPREHAEESPQTHVWGLRMGVYHVGSVAQPYHQEAQRKEDGGDALSHEVEMEVGHA